jgi:enhancing lycopene biosynthesis protein 2
VEAAIRDTHRAGKPIGALCISPVLITRVLGNVTVTIGNDPSTAKDIAAMGGRHEVKRHGEVSVDIKNRIVTAPAYMLSANLTDIARDAEAVIKAIMEMVGKK